MEWAIESELSAPIGFRWDQLLEHWVQEHQGWAPLADELVRRARLAGQAPPAADTVLRGLRRLAGRSHAAGGQYGRWMIQHEHENVLVLGDGDQT